MAGDFDIWARLERSVQASSVAAPAQTSATTPSGDQKPDPARRRLRRQIFVLDLASSTFWLYALTKIFVGDVDRSFLEWLAPALLPVLDFRLFLYLGTFVVLLYVLRRRAWLVVLYVALFPLIVLVWKVPAYFWRRRSWPLLLGVAQALFSALSDFRYKLVTTSLALLSAVVVLLTDITPAIVVAIALIIVLLVLTYVRTATRAIASPSFVSVQQRTITRILSSDRTRQVLALKADYRRSDIDRYESGDAQQVMIWIAAGIALNKALLLWAHQLERYRRQYLPSLVFGGFSLGWLFLGTWLSLTLANLGLNKVAPDQFLVSGSGSLVAFALYSLTTFAASQGGGLTAMGDWAFGLQLIGGLCGVLVFAYLVANVVFALRRARDEEATRELILALRRHAAEQGREFRREYSLSVDEAKQKLEEIGFAFASFLTRLSASIPDEPSEGKASG